MNIEEIKAREQAAQNGNVGAIQTSQLDVRPLLAEVKRLTAENERDEKLIESYKESGLEQATESYELEKQIATLKEALEWAIEDMNHITNGIANCKEFISGGTDKVNALKLGRCDVCKGICHDDKSCHFEWRGIQQEAQQLMHETQEAEK